MEKLWTRASDMAGGPSVIRGRLMAELGRISSVMKRALRAYDRRGPGGRSNSSQVHQANASAATPSAVEIHVSLVGHKDLPARSTGSCAGRGRPPQAAARRAGLDGAGKVLTKRESRPATQRHLSSPDLSWSPGAAQEVLGNLFGNADPV